MNNMAEVKHYPCFHDVMDVLMSTKVSDWRLSKIWQHIGPSVEIFFNNNENIGKVTSMVTKMFTTSPHAYDLMVELLTLNPAASKIRIFPKYYFGKNAKQLTSDFNLFAKEPVIFFKKGCEFFAVLYKSGTIIDMYLWDLSQNPINTDDSILNTVKTFDKCYSKKIAINTANCVEKRAYIHEKVSKMFSEDPISTKLKIEILKFNPNVEVITVKFDLMRSINGKQNLNDIYYVIRNHENIHKPILVVEKDSQFIAIICTAENNVTELFIWDMENCI